MISNDIKRRFEEEKVSFNSFVYSNSQSAKVRTGAAEVRQDAQKIIRDLFGTVVSCTQNLNKSLPNKSRPIFNSRLLEDINSSDSVIRKRAAVKIMDNYYVAIADSKDDQLLISSVGIVKAAFEKKDKDLIALTEKMIFIKGNSSPTSITSACSSPTREFISPECPSSENWKKALRGPKVTPSGSLFKNLFQEEN